MPAAPKPSNQGVYSISVASELSGVGSQTLRLYERRHLIEPTRTSGGTRRYSDDDLRRIARITELVNTGINLVGVQRILPLEDECALLREVRSGDPPDAGSPLIDDGTNRTPDPAAVEHDRRATVRHNERDLDP